MLVCLIEQLVDSFTEKPLKLSMDIVAVDINELYTYVNDRLDLVLKIVKDSEQIKLSHVSLKRVSLVMS